MSGYATLENLLREEIIQRTEEGCNTDGFLEKLEKLVCVKNSQGKINELYNELMKKEIDSSFKFDEPTLLSEIKEKSPLYKNKTQPENIPFDKFYGAWLGRCCGCALGKPVEAPPYMFGNDNPGWKNVYEWFKGANAYPITDYTPLNSTAKETNDLYINSGCLASCKENIKFMETDDDIRYTVLGLKLLEEKGTNFNQFDVGNLWHNYLPYNMTFTAEKQAYLNYMNRIDMLSWDSAEEEKDAFINYVRMNKNPYREWIGAQIRIDAYAYAAAGNPTLAAELAYKDASFSHVKNGIYGAMFCAGMIAEAFVENDNIKIIEAGLAQIPANSRLAEAVKKAIEIANSSTDELELVERIWNEFKCYNGVHTINNAALCVAALVYAKDDFQKAITVAVLGGWDTDCNGATVGSIMGAKLGADKIPDKWKKPLNDTLYSAIPDFHPISISECARRTQEVYKKVFKANNQ